MDRNRFLKLLKDFDDNYTAYHGSLQEHVKKQAKENGTTIKETFKDSKNLLLYSQIDYNKIQRLTIIDTSTDEDIAPSCFSFFYEISEDQLKFFFKTIHHTNYLLKNNDNSFDTLRTYREKQSLINKYQAVIDDMKSIEKDTQWLSNRMEELTKSFTPTKRMIFENLLFSVFLIIRFDVKNNKQQLTQKITDITNGIIDTYFDEDVRFSKKTNINNFHEYTYNTIRVLNPSNSKTLQNVDHKITLFHSPYQIG